MIFQEPMTALNPLYTVEKQVSEVLRQHSKLDAAESSLGSRIGQALLYPVTLLNNFIRNDMKAGLQLLGTFLFIFLVQQSGNSGLVLDFLAIPLIVASKLIVIIGSILVIAPASFTTSMAWTALIAVSYTHLTLPTKA